MLADILSLPCSEDIKEKFGCLQAKQLGHHPAFQHMRQHGGPHESPMCHTKDSLPHHRLLGFTTKTQYSRWNWEVRLGPSCLLHYRDCA